MDDRTKSEKLGRIVFLDYLRIFAFLSVVVGHKFLNQIHHYIIDANHHATPRLVLEYLSHLLVGGGAGVIVFFLISGYIITHVLSTEAPVEFLVKRAFRIFPLYWFAVFSEIIFSGQLPNYKILIPELLLVGDFFSTPYSLKGVEWTLRIEVMFYLFMAALKSLGFFDKYRKWLPYTFFGATILLGQLPPIPVTTVVFQGYFSIYLPFLFIGSFFYLREKKECSLGLMLLFCGMMFYQYYHLIELYQRAWLKMHFALLGVLVFLTGWKLRSQMVATTLVLVLSDLTYSVYLFHNWAWDPLKDLLASLSIAFFDPDLQALIALLTLCYILNKTIEKAGVRLGRKVVQRIKMS